MKTMPKADVDLGEDFAEQTIAEQEAEMERIRARNAAAAGVILRDATGSVSEDDIRATLNQRAATHGDYTDHAHQTQILKEVMRANPGWNKLDWHERETLEMIAHKIGRILTGNPHFHDHWHDIAGYATLSADRNK